MAQTRDEAIRRARLEFGGVDQTKEEYRDARALWPVESIVQYGREIRYAMRMLLRTPAFTAVSALSVALGSARTAPSSASTMRYCCGRFPSRTLAASSRQHAET
jgi:hypothetical protein